MEDYNPVFDGIPGVVPGFVKLPLPQEFECESPLIPIQSVEKSYTQKLINIPKRKRRMMPCDKD